MSWSDSEDEIVPIILYNMIKLLDEQEEVKKRKWWVHPYNQIREEDNVVINIMAELRDNPDKFRDFIRMKIETFDYLLNLIENSIRKRDTNYRKSIKPSERLFITLRYLATGDSFKSLSHYFRCGGATIERLTIETCKSIWEALLPIYIPTPDTQKWQRIANEFKEMWNFPNCLGAIDGMDIRIQCRPSRISNSTKYKKEKYLLHLQAVVDARDNSFASMLVIVHSKNQTLANNY